MCDLTLEQPHAFGQEGLVLPTDWQGVLPPAENLEDAMGAVAISVECDIDLLTVARGEADQLDPFSRAHSYRAAIIAVRVAQEVNERVPEEWRCEPAVVCIAALAHDIGKRHARVWPAVEKSVYRPDEPWLDADTRLMSEHVMFSYYLGQAAGLPETYTLIMANHHAVQPRSAVWPAGLAPLTHEQWVARDHVSSGDVIEAYHRNNTRTAGSTEADRLALARTHFWYQYGAYPQPERFVEPALQGGWEVYHQLRRL